MCQSNIHLDSGFRRDVLFDFSWAREGRKSEKIYRACRTDEINIQSLSKRQPPSPIKNQIAHLLEQRKCKNLFILTVSKTFSLFRNE